MELVIACYIALADQVMSPDLWDVLATSGPFGLALIGVIELWKLMLQPELAANRALRSTEADLMRTHVDALSRVADRLEETAKTNAVQTHTMQTLVTESRAMVREVSALKCAVHGQKSGGLLT